jgi:hypothetical protein
VKNRRRDPETVRQDDWYKLPPVCNQAATQSSAYDSRDDEVLGP